MTITGRVLGLGAVEGVGGRRDMDGAVSGRGTPNGRAHHGMVVPKPAGGSGRALALAGRPCRTAGCNAMCLRPVSCCRTLGDAPNDIAPTAGRPLDGGVRAGRTARLLGGVRAGRTARLFGSIGLLLAAPRARGVAIFLAVPNAGDLI